MANTTQSSKVSSKVMNRAFFAVCIAGIAFIIFVYLDSEKIIKLTKTEAVAVACFFMLFEILCYKNVIDYNKRAEAYRKSKEDLETNE